jgi:hypothetical protein
MTFKWENYKYKMTCTIQNVISYAKVNNVNRRNELGSQASAPLICMHFRPVTKRMCCRGTQPRFSVQHRVSSHACTYTTYHSHHDILHSHLNGISHCVMWGFRREVAQNCAFWVFTQSVVVISYPRFGKTYRFHPQVSRSQISYWRLGKTYRPHLLDSRIWISYRRFEINLWFLYSGFEDPKKSFYIPEPWG